MTSKSPLAVCCYIPSLICLIIIIACNKAVGEDTARSAEIQQAVRDLVHVTSIHLRGEHIDDRFRKLVLFGFDAVPALLDHLDDSLLTKVEAYPLAGEFLEVRDIVVVLLQGLACPELGTTVVREDLGRTLRRSDVERWFKKARLIGEESYSVRNVLDDTRWPNQIMLVLLTNKYPTRLEGVYRRLLEERPSMISDPVVEAIVASNLNPATKRKLISYGFGSKELAHRVAALRALPALDAYSFDRRIVKELDSLPETPRVPFWRCPEARLARLVCETNNPAVWKALIKTAQRSHVGLRMEFLGAIRCSPETIKTRAQQLRFLATFLGDKTVRDVSASPVLFSGPYAGTGEGPRGDRRFARIEVRNYAALCIAHALPLAVEYAPRPTWAGAEWVAFRRIVTNALTAEGVVRPENLAGVKESSKTP